VSSPVKDIIELAASHLVNSRHAIVLTGAGMSTESGIPDFRGPKGIWTTDKAAEAKAYERYELFLKDPVSYWEEMMERDGTHGSFYHHIREAEPNAGHRALASLEEMGVIKSVLTQNIDGLHRKAGSRNVIEYHGSVDRVRCPSCGLRRGIEEVDRMNLPPYCACGSVMKYDVVHFGEPIPHDVMEGAEIETLKCDVMLVCGTSAVVFPFAGLPRAARQHDRLNTRIFEVNSEPTPLTCEGISDHLIQGSVGEILPEILNSVRAVSGSD